MKRSMFTSTFNPRAGSAVRLGDATEFNPLSDVTVSRICSAVNKFNEWEDFQDTGSGDRIRRDSVANVQSIIDSTPPGLQKAAISQIRLYCDNADALLDFVHQPGPGTIPAIPSSQTMVPSVDRNREEPPPPPNEYPPVATGERGPGRGAFGYRPSVQSGLPGPGYIPPTFPPSGFTGSEPEIPPTGPELPPPPPMPPARPAVATPSVGCWYVMGKGYAWGPRPSSGESTGLNQKDCEALIQRDLEIRNPVATPPGQTAQQTGTVNSTPSWNTAPGATRPGESGVASVDCGPGQFWDGTKCRGSVSMPNLPGGIPGDSGGMTAASSVSDFPSGMPSATSSIGYRRVALRGVHSNGNLEWWSYQQAFLPPLYFSRRRANYATLARPVLGVGKPVPPGICCQATPDGGAICSTGQGFPPDCPNKPEPNVPGVAEYIQQGGYMVPKPPPVPVNGACAVPAAPAAKPAPAEEGSGIAPIVGLAAVGALIYALVG